MLGCVWPVMIAGWTCLEGHLTLYLLRISPFALSRASLEKKSSLIFCLLLLALTPGSCLLLQSSLPFTVFSQLGCGDTFVLSSCHLTGQDLLCSGALDLGFYCLTPTEHIWTLSPQLSAILWFFLQYKVCPFQTH